MREESSKIIEFLKILKSFEAVTDWMWSLPLLDVPAASPPIPQRQPKTKKRGGVFAACGSSPNKRPKRPVPEVDFNQTRAALLLSLNKLKDHGDGAQVSAALIQLKKSATSNVGSTGMLDQKHFDVLIEVFQNTHRSSGEIFSNFSMALNLALSARGSEASVKSLIRTSLFIEWTAEQIQEIVASVDSTRLAGHADVRVEDCLEGLEQPPTWMQPLSTDSVLRSEDHQSPLSEPKLNPEPAAATVPAPVPAPKPEPAPEPEPASSELATTRHIPAPNGAAARSFRLTPQLQMKPEDLAPIASSIWRILLLNIGLLLISVGAAVCALQPYWSTIIALF